MRILLTIVLVLSANLAHAQSPDGTKVPPATQLIVPAAPNVWTLGKPVLASPGNFEILRNGKLAGTGGNQLVLCQSSVFANGRDRAWWRVTKENNISVEWLRTGTLPCDGTVPPPPPPLCTTKLCVGDVAQVTIGNNLLVRASPDIAAVPINPKTPLAAGVQGKVAAVGALYQAPDTRRWVRIVWSIGTYWSLDGTLCKVVAGKCAPIDNKLITLTSPPRPVEISTPGDVTVTRRPGDVEVKINPDRSIDVSADKDAAISVIKP